MNLVESHRARAFHSALLLLCGLSCTAIAIGTEIVARANQSRRSQIRQLAEVLARPDRVGEGPIVGLEGMFGCELQRVTTVTGPAVVFSGRARGGRT